MRSLKWIAAVGLVVGCTARPMSVVSDAGTSSLDDLLRARPLAAGANIRADEIARTTAASVHLVQVSGGETPHRHATHDLTVAMLRGSGSLTIGGTTRPMSVGDVAVIPRGVRHYFVRSGGVPAVALVVFAPPLDAPDSVPDPVAVDSPRDDR
jgi:quercetin dioxygenase-like cupin family protein